jgi:hypothetical protein
VADEEKKSRGSTVKIVATVFGAIIAPLTVGLALKWFDPANYRSTQPQGSPASQPAAQGPTTPGRGASPPLILHLVSLKLSDHFYSYGWSAPDMAVVRNDNVDPAFFRYAGTPSSIAVTGQHNRIALLETKNEFEDYTLYVDYRRDEKTWGPREGKARAAAILLHATGPDGVLALAGTSAALWPQSVLVSLTEGTAGSFRLMGAPGKVKGIAKVKEIPRKTSLWRAYVGGNLPGLPLVTGEPPEWGGFICRLGMPEEIEDVKGWHPPGDPEIADLQPGQWNKVMIECHQGAIKVFINNKFVNEITDLNLRKGRIGFASTLADYSIGRIELEVHPEGANR